jgi:predicted RNase H-like nuclease
VSLHRGPTLPYSIVCGVTPCPRGWLVQAAKLHGATFAPEPPRVYPTFLEILMEHPAYTDIVINAPIGYLDTPEQGARTCDREARALVGPRRGTAIHNAPSRAVLNGIVGWLEGGLDAVTATLLPRFREVASEMSPFRQRVVYEGNPELSFYQLNQDTSMRRSKRIEEGRDERIEVLESHIQGMENVIDVEIENVSEKHRIDALALLWTARRVYGRSARRIPTDPEWDSEGLRMEIVY